MVIQNLKLRTQLFSLIGILLALMFLTTGIALYQMVNIGAEIKEITEEDMPLTKIITAITVHQLEQAIAFEKMLRFVGVSEAERRQFSQVETSFQKLAEVVDREIKEGEELAEHAIQHALSETSRKEFQNVLQELKIIEKQHMDYDKHVFEVAELYREGKVEIARKMSRMVEKEEAELDHHLTEFLHHIESFTEQSLIAVEQHEETAIWLLSVIFLASVVISFLLGFILSQAILRQIGGEPIMIEKLAARVTEGDLDIEFEKKKVTGIFASIQKQITTLNTVFNEVKMSSEEVGKGSDQLAETSQLIAQGASEQAASLEHIAASMEQVTAQTLMNAEYASQASQLTSEACQHAEVGNDKMQRMLVAMEEINHASENISKIVKSIDEIAFQTNLLAINAAVEAARSGVHGKGFAVVAEEVRNLAQRSAEAAKETTAMIDDSIQKIQSGVSIADETATSLAQIVSGIAEVRDLVGQINHSSNEQSKGMDAINEEVHQLNRVTQQNAQVSEETAASSEELREQSNHLRTMLAHFKLRDSVDRLPSHHRFAQDSGEHPASYETIPTNLPQLPNA